MTDPAVIRELATLSAKMDTQGETNERMARTMERIEAKLDTQNGNVRRLEVSNGRIWMVLSIIGSVAAAVGAALVRQLFP